LEEQIASISAETKRTAKRAVQTSQLDQQQTTSGKRKPPNHPQQQQQQQQATIENMKCTPEKQVATTSNSLTMTFGEFSQSQHRSYS
jgi:hypothetical protein